MNTETHIELSDAEITAIREGLRGSGDKNLIPLGFCLSDYQIERMVTILAEQEAGK